MQNSPVSMEVLSHRNPFQAPTVKNCKPTKPLRGPQRTISGKQELLLCALKRFYEVPANIEMILPIVKQETSISLRLLDWLVTNYSKQYGVQYPLPGTNGVTKNFNIWLDYKNQLKAYSKKIFDPFCRRQRIFFNTDNYSTIPINDEEVENYQRRDNGFVTTVGQLNFFRWALTHRVVDYAFDNLSSIESDMLLNADSRKETSSNGKRRKREVSKSSKGIHKHDVKVIIQFP